LIEVKEGKLGLSVQSGRQFRSYIISWFLMIVGLIVVFGAIAIFDRAQGYLLGQYKKSKLQQVNTAASLIDPHAHATLSAYQTESDLFKTLVRAFKEIGQSGSASLRVFSLNYDPEQKRLIYAVDPRKVSDDSIHISSDFFDLLLSRSNAQILLDQRTLIGGVRGKEGLVNGSPFEWKKEKNAGVLLVDGQEIFRLGNGEKLAGEFQDFKIDAKNLTARSVKVELPQLAKLEYRYIGKDQWLHLPGNEFFAETNVKNQLLHFIRKGQTMMWSIDEKELVSDNIIVVPLAANGNKQLSGAIVVEIPAIVLQTISDEFLKSVLLIFSLMGILILIAAIFFSRKITGPLEQLNLAIDRLIHNDFNFKLSAKGFGSFHFLAEQFNQMLKHIQQGRNELISLNKSYSRFVPHQLLKQLSPSGVNDISLGDCCERDMTVLFCDIRGFTTLSESMTPQANFNFINRYLSQIAPVINKRGGIIDKYLGDGIMALFPNGADQALKAAIEMLQALDVYNQRLMQKNLPIIEVGLGLHSGRMMLGTVGTSARMDATVVSDTVNAAARVESMTKAFCTKILITEETKRQLVDLNYYRMRYIASCSIQGKSKPVTLYEVFNSDAVSLQQEKASNQPTMIRAWKCYKNGDVASAIALYQRLIERTPDDKSLFALIERCQSGRL
jgi:class 3 adenylate cyclase